MVNTNYSAGTAGSYTQKIVPKKTAATGGSFAEKVAEKADVSPEDMTLEEYKAYFRKKVDCLYTHPSQRKINWVIEITNAAYERMKTDPEYEQKVLNALAADKARGFGNSMPQFAWTHIDDTWEKSYTKFWGVQERYPAPRTNSGDEESWWDKRQKRIKEGLKRQAKAAQKRAQAQSVLGRQAALDKQMESQQRRRILFAEKIPGEPETTDYVPFSSASAKALAASFYAEALYAFSERLVGKS